MSGPSAGSGLSRISQQALGIGAGAQGLAEKDQVLRFTRFGRDGLRARMRVGLAQRAPHCAALHGGLQVGVQVTYPGDGRRAHHDRAADASRRVFVRALAAEKMPLASPAASDRCGTAKRAGRRC